MERQTESNAYVRARGFHYRWCCLFCSFWGDRWLTPSLPNAVVKGSICFPIRLFPPPLSDVIRVRYYGGNKNHHRSIAQMCLLRVPLLVFRCLRLYYCPVFFLSFSLSCFVLVVLSVSSRGCMRVWLVSSDLGSRACSSSLSARSNAPTQPARQQGVSLFFSHCFFLFFFPSLRQAWRRLGSGRQTGQIPA